MIQKQTNQDLITASFLDLLDANKSFKSITIQDIAENCGVSRRTFYNAFNDKYDIIIYLYRNQFSNKKHNENQNFNSTVLSLCKSIADNRLYWKKILKNDSCREYFHSHLFHDLFQALSGKAVLDTYEKSLLRFYCFGCSQMICDWMLSGCQQDAGDMALVLTSSIPDQIKYIF